MVLGLHDGDGGEDDAIVLQVCDAHDVAAELLGLLAQDGGQRLKQAFGDEVAVEDEIPQVLDELIVELGGLLENANIVLDRGREEAIAVRRIR